MSGERIDDVLDNILGKIEEDKEDINTKRKR